MCWEDVQIGRATRTKLHMVNVPQNVITQLCPASKHRRVLCFWPAASVSLYVSTDSDVGADNGIILSSQTVLSIELFVERHGDITQEAFYAFRSGAGTVRVAVLEGFLPMTRDEVMRAWQEMGQ